MMGSRRRQNKKLEEKKEYKLSKNMLKEDWEQMVAAGVDFFAICYIWQKKEGREE
jgi:hypothetical protein